MAKKVSKKSPKKTPPAKSVKKKVLKTSPKKKSISLPRSDSGTRKDKKEKKDEKRELQSKPARKQRSSVDNKKSSKSKRVTKRVAKRSTKVVARKPKSTRKIPAKPVKQIIQTPRPKKAPPKHAGKRISTDRKRAKPTRAVREHAVRVVALDPQTKKEIQKPKTGEEVILGLKGKRGKIKVIESRFSQPYSVQDINGIQKSIDISGTKNFIIYEELTKEKFRDPKTNLLKQAEKLTYGKSNRAQRPVLYSEGKRVRETDLGYRVRSKRQIVDSMFEYEIKPNNKVLKDIYLDGATIKETVNKIAFKFTMDEVQRLNVDGVFYEIELKVQGHENFKVYGKSDVYANLVTDIARQIRFSLANHGLRFTSLVDVETLAMEIDAENPEAAHGIRFIGKEQIPAENFRPIFPEFEGLDTEHREGKKSISMNIRLTYAR